MSSSSGIESSRCSSVHHRREWIGAMLSTLALADAKLVGEMRQHATALPAEEHRDTGHSLLTVPNEIFALSTTRSRFRSASTSNPIAVRALTWVASTDRSH